MTNEQILKFISAGNATFTLESLKTNTHYTFKVKKSDNGKMLWVSVLHDGDKYTYLGTIFTDNHNWRYSLTGKSTKSPLHEVISWFVRLLMSEKNHPDLIFRHAGTCGRCGRELTTPNSIDSGIGPICATKL